MSDEKNTEQNLRRYVVKSNDLILNSRFHLQARELDILNYLTSKVRPQDVGGEEYVFSIPEFCEVSGIKLQENGGYYYKDLKMKLKHIADSSAWIRTEDGKEHLFRWLDEVSVEEKSSEIRVTFHKTVQPYLYALHERYTQYRLQETICMKSQYSKRLYELLKSFAFGKQYDNYQEREVYYTVDELKVRVDAEKYTQYGMLKKRVLEPAVEEINTYSEQIHVEMLENKSGPRVVGISFMIKIPTAKQMLAARDAKEEKRKGERG